MFSMFLIEICVILLLFKYVSVGNMSKRVQQHLNKKKKSVFLATRPKRSPKMTRQSQNQNDTCRWNLYPDGLFSVSVTYNDLVTNYVSQIQNIQDSNPILSKFWNSAVPIKVLVFSWRLFLDRLRTREQLNKRRILILNV